MHYLELRPFVLLLLSILPVYETQAETTAPSNSQTEVTLSNENKQLQSTKTAQPPKKTIKKPPSPTIYKKMDSAYITDKLYVYMRKGGSHRHKLSGSITAGSPVTILENAKKDDGFVYIQDQRGRKAWVEAKWLTLEPAPSTQIPLLKETINQLKFELETLDKQKADWKNSLTAISVENAKLSKKIKFLEEEREKHRTLLADQNQTLYMGWFVRGGVLAIGCMIIGVLLNYLPRRQKQSAGWV